MFWNKENLTRETLKKAGTLLRTGDYCRFADTIDMYIFDALRTGVRLKNIRKVESYTKYACESIIYPAVRSVLAGISISGETESLDENLDILKFCCKYTERDPERMVKEFSRWTIASAFRKAIEKSREGNLERAIYLMSAKNYADKHPERFDRNDINDSIDKIQDDYPSHMMRRNGWYGSRGSM